MLHWKNRLHEHVEDYVDQEKPKHQFLDFLKDKIENLAHHHDELDGEDEKEAAARLGLDHYENLNNKEGEKEEMENTPTEVAETEVTDTELPEVYLNYLDEDREVIEPIALHEVSDMLLDYLEKNNHLDELERIYDDTKASARTKGFLNRLFVFKKLYSRKREGEIDYFSKSLAYPPADVVNDLFFALEQRL